MSALLDSVEAADAERWDRWSTPAGPAAQHGWFAALEAALSSSGPDRWTPAHLQGDGVLVPLFEREGWLGEFVWEEPIIDACATSGLPYGPRAVGTIPWTPIRGPRVLTDPDGDRASLLAGAPTQLLAACDERGWTGAHLEFCADDEVDAFVAAGWIERLTWQHVWQRDPAVDRFLGHLPGKRRRELHREMRAFDEQGLRLEVLSGLEAPDAVWSAMPQLYADTAARHGDPVPLGPIFFETVRERMAADVVFFAAFRGEELVAATFQLRSDDALLGRIWGTREPHPFLHFNLAYHFPMRWAWEQGLDRFEPGHGGDYKRTRGGTTVLCRSVHHFAHPGLHRAVSAWARREATWVRGRIAESSTPTRPA